jgi:polyisoprenyl-teichoic acid--peptidoglycan teichoic acid transferase
VLHLAAGLTGHPVRQVRFPGTLINGAAPAPAPAAPGQPVFQAPGLGDFVTATPQAIQRAVQRFLYPQAAPRPVRVVPARHASRRHRKRPSVTAADYGLVGAFAHARALVRPALRSSHMKLPFFAPRWLTPHGRYPPSSPIAPSPRIYKVADRAGHPHRAYRMVVEENVAEGQYYGIQGIAWVDPPILRAASTTLRMGRRSYELFYDGGHLRIVAFKTAKGAYWVSNTLTRSLSNKQMLGIARSLTRIR